MTTLWQHFHDGWADGCSGTDESLPRKRDAVRAYRAGYEQGQRDRQDAEKLAKELYGEEETKP